MKQSYLGSNIKVKQEQVEAVDYVVEQGINYTKWNSGKVEMNFEISGTAIQSAHSAIFGDCPTSYLETPTPQVFASVIRANLNYQQITIKSVAHYGGGRVRVEVHNERTANQTVYLSVYLVGRWK